MTQMRAVFLLVLAIAIFSIVLATSYNFWEVKKAPVPPHELKDTRVEPSVVAPDEHGRIKIKIFTGSIRNLRCYAIIYRTFARADPPQKTVLTLVMLGGMVPATGKPQEVPFDIELSAADFPPGRYSYTAYAVNKCESPDDPSQVKTYIALANMSFFEVVARQP